MITTIFRRAATLLAVLIMSASTVAACGSGDGGSSQGPKEPAARGSIAAGVPKDIQNRGYITVATDATYPPFGYFKKDGKTIIGIDVDLAEALEPLLGVEVRVVNVSFDNFIPGLQSKRYDAGFSSISDTPERRKVVDFVDYQRAGGVFLTTLDSPLKLTELTSACGVRVGAVTGSDIIKVLEALTPDCEAAGKDPVDIKVFASEPAVRVALSSKRVDAILTGGSTGGYTAKQSKGKFKVNGPLLADINGEFSLGGMALTKDAPLSKAMLKAVTELYANGTLKSIYAKYGIAGDNLITPGLNLAKD